MERGFQIRRYNFLLLSVFALSAIGSQEVSETWASFAGMGFGLGGDAWLSAGEMRVDTFFLWGTFFEAHAEANNVGKMGVRHDDWPASLREC